MTYTEIKERGNKKYYYRAKSIRKGEKIEKQRVYLGTNLTKEQVKERENKADEKLSPETKENSKEQEKQINQTKETKIKTEKIELGITAEKDELSEWYVQILQKAELIEYTNVSGSYIIRPRAYSIWEKVQKYFDEKIKKDGVKNCYFPLLIPESLLMKEKEHVKGFSPEVAWVTHTGNTELSEKLAIRPTSETAMYTSFSKWIRSWRDLPLRLNQWVNVVRWEFKHPVPFIRSREFLWQEGHSAFSTKQEADKEASKILDFYADVYKNIYAIPVIKGIKTEKEKFAGADYTLTTEVFLPSGKSAQGATSHHLGQNFAKAFDIKFKDKDEKEKLVFQNSWGISTRSIGIAIIMHSDDKGLVLSPNASDIQVVIIPIANNEQDRKTVLDESEKIKQELNKLRVEIDTRDSNPGFKFNDWEMKGVPLRIEIGPRDLKNKSVVFARRDTGKKENVKISDIKEKVQQVLEEIHNSLYKKAEKYIAENTVSTNNMQEVIESVKNKKLVKANWCGSEECETWIKDKTQGAKIICIIPDEKPPANSKCVYCGKKAKHQVYISKSY